MNKIIKLSSVLITILFLASCASNTDTVKVDTELYQGAPIDSLSLDEPPKSEEEAIQRADKALSRNSLDLALYEYIRSLSFPDAKFQDKSLYNIGRIHQSRENFALAETAYLRSLEYNPSGIEPLNQLGVIYSKSGRVAEGSAHFLKAVNADQIRFNKPENVIESFELIKETEITDLAVDNTSPIQSYIGLGVLADVDARYDVAKRLYEKALEINPRSTKALINLGYSHYMSGNYHLAKRLMTTALQYEPKNERAINNLALTHIALGENTSALNVFMRQMEAPEALNNVGYFLILQGKPEQAVPYLQQAIDKKPSYYKVANENLNRAIAEIRAKQDSSASIAPEDDTKS